MRRYVLLLLIAATVLMATAQSIVAADTRSDEADVVSWIYDRANFPKEYPAYGGIFAAADPAGYGVDGTSYYSVVPYYAHYSVLALLDCSAPGSPERKQALTIARNWINWYFGHLKMPFNVHGPVSDVYYTRFGKQEYSSVSVKNGNAVVTLKDHVDAVDSAIALFLIVLDRYVASGGEKSIFAAPDRADKIKSLIDQLVSLKAPSGLYKVSSSTDTQYLEDNCEDHAGFIAASRVARLIPEATQLSDDCAKAAGDLHQKIGERLWLDTKRGWTYAYGFDQALDSWYEGMQCHMWPTIWGVVSPSDEKATNPYGNLTSRWQNGPNRLDWRLQPAKLRGQPFTYPEAAYFSMLLTPGDQASAKMWLDTEHRYKIPALASSSGTGVYFNLADASWLLRVVHAMNSRALRVPQLSSP